MQDKYQADADEQHFVENAFTNGRMADGYGHLLQKTSCNAIFPASGERRIDCIIASETGCKILILFEYLFVSGTGLGSCLPVYRVKTSPNGYIN
uniref:Uncharacterized protein n=1 Tax=Glossina palpalis gambiensis TaxID=67801 RepID=A0A1B0AUH6_9MUSC